MHRDELYKQFVKRFSAPSLHRIAPVPVGELETVERELKTTLPASYVSFVTCYGPVFTPGVSDMVGDCEACVPPEEEVFAVREFLSPFEIIKDYHACVQGGMADWLIPFAVDLGGHLFGFKRQMQHPRAADSPVFIFDHDYSKISKEADGFDCWLEYYLSLPI